MNKSSFSIISMVLVAASIQANGQTVERQSPMFIDQVHCEGLSDEKVVTAPFGMNSAGDDLSKQLNIDFNRKRCEDIFALYGIEKFQWVTPEDLERLDLAVRVSNRFRSAAFRIEKSTLQNHVHLIGTFQAYRRYVKLTSNAKVETHFGKGEESNRENQSLRVDFETFKSSPNSPAMLKYYVKVDNSFAKNAIDPKSFDSSEDQANLSAEKEAALGRKDYGYRSFGMQLSFFNTGYEKYAPFIDLSYEASHLTNDFGYGVTNRAELGYHINQGVYGTTLISPSVVVIRDGVSATQTYEKVENEDGTTSRKTPDADSVAFAGVTIKSTIGSANTSSKFYHSVSKTNSWYLDIDSVAYSSKVHPTFGQFGIAGRVTSVRNAVLPEFRRGSPDMTELRAAGILRKQLTNSIALHSKVGAMNYAPTHYGTTSGASRSSVFGELGMQLQNQYFDCSLALTAASGRLY